MFVARRVVEQNRIERLRAIPGESARTNPAEIQVRGQLVGRHVISVVRTANDQGAIRVPFFKDDDHFLPQPRPEECAPAIAGPSLGDSHPARTAGIELSLAIPMELNFDATLFIDKNLISSGSDDSSRLHAFDSWA